MSFQRSISKTWVRATLRRLGATLAILLVIAWLTLFGLILADLGVKALPNAEALLKLRARLPKATLVAEAALTPKQLQDLAGIIAQFKQTAPDLEFAFRVVIMAEGERPSGEVLAKLNELLKEVKSGWRIE